MGQLNELSFQDRHHFQALFKAHTGFGKSVVIVGRSLLFQLADPLLQAALLFLATAILGFKTSDIFSGGLQQFPFLAARKAQAAEP